MLDPIFFFFLTFFFFYLLCVSVMSVIRVNAKYIIGIYMLVITT